MSGPERVDLKKLAERFSTEEIVIAAGSLVLLVALFLDWISFNCGGLVPLCNLGGGSGFHGWGWLTFLALVGVAGLLVARRLLSEQVNYPPVHRRSFLPRLRLQRIYCVDTGLVGLIIND